jgi:hypothetical protein
MTIPHGSPESYKEWFSDIFCDIQADEPTTAENLVLGLRLAINDWQNYYRIQDKEFDRLKSLLSEAFTDG